ncbi:cupin family protein [Forsythia ovata]|uniref:Cupin family protein n=1 Tax=Forsythia ovata TaxID=205694 RepID=A0ABD1X793_9LAMI
MRFARRVCVVILAVLLVFVSVTLGKDPYKEYQKCQKQCQQESEGGYSQQKRCQQGCAEELQRRQEEKGSGRGSDDMYEGRQEEQEQEQEQNPYVFEDRHFTTRLQSQHGRFRVLQNFAERSKLLLGIGNYRVAVLEAEPQTFVVPHHWDADTLLYVAQGKGTVSLVSEEKRESFNIQEGDILRISAGTTTYMINRDNHQKLVIAKLIRPVATPGYFESFFGAGGENPESFYRAFSDEILEAALNTRKDKWQRLFGQQRQGAILKASQEQIRAMSREEEGGQWPFGGQSKGSVNIYEQRPSQSNQYGKLYEVDSRQYRQLQDIDVSVSLANVTKGAMIAPYYNSEATKISIVLDGEGYFEMACPHLSSHQEGQGQQQHHGGSQQQQRGPSYQKVSSRLKRGTVVVIPAGHPFVAVASNNQNLQVLCFEINSRNNQRYPLAGKKNIINQYEREAKELAFGVSAREVDEVFRSQNEEFFFKGPRQQPQGRADE